MILGCLILILGVVTWLVATEGVWGAASTLVCVVISGLIAMNFFEPLALYLNYFVPALSEYVDFISLVGLFAVSTIVLRESTAYLSPVDIRMPDLLDLVGKWVVAAVVGYVTMAILLTALHTAPLPREFFDFRPESPTFFGIAPDRQWLGFVQYVSEHSLKRTVTVIDPVTKQPLLDPLTRQPLTMPNIFDGQFRRVGDPQTPHPNSIWSSFPIRYAMRRAQIEQGGVAAATQPLQPVAVPVGGQTAPPAGGF
jgi:hypothetical protein